ncbi:MAG: citrate/2-methylcitrate synthase [Clostridia bacterium]|nr:citrate/2-methylcitrate synthase [Clostridia bacterium]
MEVFYEELLKNQLIDRELYTKYDVKRGLRDSSGKGVLTGLTEISDVVAFEEVDGNRVPIDGRLYYQGCNVEEIINNLNGRKFGFEETIYLLMFGKLPSVEELDKFIYAMAEMQSLNNRFVRDVVMKASNANIMNAMQRCVLTLYTYDADPDGISPQNVLRQSLELINKLPLIAVYSYMSYRHFRMDKSLLIKNPEKGLSLAENILYMLRPDGKYTALEAKVLDIALILHAEHGGGNNSTFTTHVVTSSGTDTYSSVSASIGSLKGPRHGGANLKVLNMFRDIKEHVSDWSDEKKISEYLTKILAKEAFDGSGLIYGMGHAVYTLSDPREVILKKFARSLAEEKGLLEEFEFYNRIEKIAGKLIMEKHKVQKNVCANVDFYSGFVYKMLGIPEELFTPIFAIARIPGWCAHRLEELLNGNKIIRPAYKYVGHHIDCPSIEKR